MKFLSLLRGENLVYLLKKFSQITEFRMKTLVIKKCKKMKKDNIAYVCKESSETYEIKMFFLSMFFLFEKDLLFQDRNFSTKKN